MPKPALSLSLEEIQREAAEEIRWLEQVAAERQSWDWPRELLVLAHEFESLACAESLDAERIGDFTVRLAAHIKKKRLKGVDPILWRAEALEALAREKKMPNQSPQPTRLLGLRFPTARVRSTVRCQSKKIACSLPRAAEL